MSSPADSSVHSFSWGQETTSTEVGKALASEIKGRNVIVTGPSPTSIGSENAKTAAANGANLVVLVGRDPSKLELTTKAILEQSPGAKVRSLTMELDSFASVRKAAEELISWGEKFHVLINNAGIMAHPYKKTVDAFESQFATNHLGHFLFTALLLNAGVIVPYDSTHPARIVNVTSLAHRYSHVLFDDYNFSDGKTYEEWKGYGQSKTANMLFTVELSKRGKNKGLVAYSVQPGAVATNLAHAMTPEVLSRSGVPVQEDGSFPFTMKTLDQGAATSTVAAFSPAILSEPGSYLDHCQITRPAEDDPQKNNPDFGNQFGVFTPAHRAFDEKDAGRLWALSENLVKQKVNL